MSSSSFLAQLVGSPVAPFDSVAAFLSPASGVLLGCGQRACSADLPGAEADAQIADMLARARCEGGPEVVMGSLPFEASGAAALVLPESVLRPPLSRLAKLRPRPSASQYQTARAASDTQFRTERFRDAVVRGLDHIATGAVQKLVLSRQMQLIADAPIAVDQLLHRLVSRHPASYVFATPLRFRDRNDSGTFVGASPELLIRKFGTRIEANPLAGTIPAHGDVQIDQSRIRQLLGSKKELREHHYTSQAVATALRPFCRDLHCPDHPEILRAGPVNHLSTIIRGELRSAETDVLTLVRALHPTPAVGGVPTDAACRLLARCESTPRGLYAGMTGWCDGQGNGEWAVSLRCAEIRGRDVRLFAGAGIVPGSDPDAEVQETENKLQTMLGGLNLRLDAVTAAV